jgi:hypothetical protein
MLLIALFVLADSAAAAKPSADGIPGGHFRLDPGLEPLIILAVGAVAAILVFTVGRSPWLGTVLNIVVFLPLLEEVLFRFIVMFGICYRVLKMPDWLAVVVGGLVFVVAHVVIAFINEAKEAWAAAKNPFITIPGFQVGEALFLAAFNGLLFMVFITVHECGFLITMIYVWAAHIMINLAAVAYNCVVNILFGRSTLLHFLPRVAFGLCGAAWLARVFFSHQIDFGLFR